MPDKQPPFKKRLQWRLECLAHSLVENLAAVLPGRWVFHAGEFLAILAWQFLPKRRRVVIRNLRIACGGQTPLAEVRRMARAAFLRAGGNLISGAHTAKLPAARLREVLEVENIEVLQSSLDAGRGVVLLLSHMGNWELLSRLIHLFPQGARTGALYRPLNNPYLDERVGARREADGTRMFSKRDPFHQITGFLREGGIVGVLVDQRVGSNGDLVRFFGRLTRASPLPSLLARRSRSDVLALSLTTERPGKWKASLLPVAPPLTTANCMHALEQAMSRSLADVFWLQERWRVRLGPEVPLAKLLGGQGSAGGKSHRALLWLPGMEEVSGLSGEWMHSDVVYEAALAEGSQAPDWLPQGMRIHRLGRHATAGACRRELAAIDARQALPLDYVLAQQSFAPLRRACTRECIPLYDLVTDGGSR